MGKCEECTENNQNYGRVWHINETHTYTNHTLSYWSFSVFPSHTLFAFCSAFVSCQKIKCEKLVAD